MKIPLNIIPIDTNGCHILIRGKINNLTANILIDTGASSTVIDSNRCLHYFGQAPIRNYDKMFTGVGVEKLETMAVTIPLLSFGDFIIEEYEVLVIDLSSVNNTYSTLDLPRIDMVLGGDLLKRCGGIINYPERELIFTHSFNR